MSELQNVLRNSYDIEDTVMKDIGLREYTVSLRTISYSGANLKKGVKGIQTIIDVIIDPTPEVSLVSLSLAKRKIGYFEAGDIWMNISATTLTQNQLLQSEGVVYDNKLWKIIQVNAVPNIGMALQWRALCRKLKDI